MTHSETNSVDVNWTESIECGKSAKFRRLDNLIRSLYRSLTAPSALPITGNKK
jgi:hypothetical protein